MVMRPIHRPPRIDGDVLNVSGNGKGRWPHCRWSVSIGEENQPYQQHPNLEVVRRSKLANVEVVLPEGDGEPGGWPDYSGPFDPGCQLQDFSHRALVGLNQEFCVQALLLMHSYMLCNANALGEAKAQELGRRMWVGHAMVAVERLQKYLGVEGDDIETVAKVLQLHPHFQPRSYVDLRVEVTGPRTARLAIGDCPALQEETSHFWFKQLGPEPHPAIVALVQHVNPRARVRALDPGSASLAWEIEIDPEAEPAEEPQEFKIAQMSGGLTFRFEERRLLRTA
jgi:hypothetical protein